MGPISPEKWGGNILYWPWGWEKWPGISSNCNFVWMNIMLMKSVCLTTWEIKEPLIGASLLTRRGENGSVSMSIHSSLLRLPIRKPISTSCVWCCGNLFSGAVDTCWFINFCDCWHTLGVTKGSVPLRSESHWKQHSFSTALLTLELVYSRKLGWHNCVAQGCEKSTPLGGMVKLTWAPM